MEVLKEVNTKVKFLCTPIKYSKQRLKRLLCNALIQPNFHYACTSWFPLLNKNTHLKQHKTNTYVFAYIHPLRFHIGVIYLRNKNWLSVSGRVEACIPSTAFKY